MKTRIFFLALLLPLIPLFASGQTPDTLRVMTYNVLNFGRAELDNCDTDCKYDELHFIVRRAQPDLLALNEMQRDAVYSDNVLERVMNKDTTQVYSRAEMNENSGGQIRNMLYYNNQKLVLQEQYAIGTETRLDIYKLYFRSEELASGDTVFLHVVSMHLKAGSSQSDRSEREFETRQLVEKLGEIGPVDNLIVTGDLNIKSSNEESFQNLLNAPGNLAIKDPINQLGSWNSNRDFVLYHTQSTRDDQLEDGGSSGGCDDRFDFVLCNQAALENDFNVQFLDGSYVTMGQDGTFYNSNILGAASPDFPLKTALYRVSDHLPVYADFQVNATLVGLEALVEAPAPAFALLGNPVRDELRFRLEGLQPGEEVKFRARNLYGQTLFSATRTSAGPAETYRIPVTEMSAGVYLLEAAVDGREPVSVRFVKQ